jgi:quercetin dioxygenase-like cupin family protein
MILTVFLPLAILRFSLKRACREATLCVHELETPKQHWATNWQDRESTVRPSLGSLEWYEKGYSSMRKLFSTCAALLSLAAIPVVGIAQTNTTQITITQSNSQEVITGSPDRFTGSVRVQSLFDAKEPARSSGGQVTFLPGARSAWHTHPLGQILIVTDGVGWVQQSGGAVQVIRKGDVVWIPAGVKHWHGATPTTTMTHIAFQEQLNGTAVNWLEKVTDEQYRLMK